MSKSATTDRKRRILDAAARVLQQRGRAATIDDIANEADYSAAALYRHFPGKDAIFQALATEISERLLEIFAEAPPLKLPFESHLKWVMYRMAEFADQQRDLFIAAVVWAPTLGDDSAPSRDGFNVGMIELMKQGIAEGVLRDDDPKLYAMAFGGMLAGLNQDWIAEGPYDMQPYIDRLFDLFLSGAAA